MPYKDKEKQREAQREWEKENRGAGKRHKVWMFIFYPDTAEVGWRDECDELGLPFLVSPLHDRDVWTAADERRNPDHIEGEVKVAHYHGLVEYPQPVGYDTVKEDFEFLHTHSIKYAKSKASMALYLTHEKCSDKVQYDWRDVLEFGGANWHDWCNELEDLHAMMKEMRQYIIANNVSEFYEFQLWCDENNDMWSRALDLKCAWAIGNFIERQGCRPLKTGNSKLPVFQSASALPSRPLKPFGSKMEVRKKSTTVEFVRTLPKSCNSKSGLGR